MPQPHPECRRDIPAALPLIALIAGLALGPLLVNPLVCALGTLAMAILLRHASPAFLALGVVLALRLGAQREAELQAFLSFDEERFTIIEAPLERDWSPRGSAFILRAESFRANGLPFREPIAIYARFEPAGMELESHISAEGLLRRNERGYYTFTLKSPLLMSYRGKLRGPAGWNRRIANRLRPHVAAHPIEVALVEALVLGRGERLTDEVRDSFKRGGTYHLLVFSGLQIAFAAAFLAALLRWLHAPRASDWLLLAFAIGAPLFIGHTASVARASIGIGLYALARILGRPTSFENLWCFAALLRLAIEPRDLTDPSFQLTYAGAGALLFIARGRKWIVHALAAELTITPLTLFHFHQFAIGGSLLTLAMSPLIFAMLVIAMLACAIPTDALFLAIGALHRLCIAMNVAAFSGFFTAPALPAMIAGYGLALLGLTLRRHRGTAMGAALTIPIVAAILQFRELRSVDHPRATFLDVGQGDAIVIRDRAHNVLVDGGGRNEDHRFGETRLLPMLLDRGISRLDAVVLTHAHPDHCGGLPAVVSHLDVGEVWISPRRFSGVCATELLEACRITATPIRRLRDGDILSHGGAKFAVHLADRTFRRSPDNNASVVLHVTLGMRTILLTGDIERDAEAHFSDRALRSDVLKVPHHGSKSSASAFLLEAVKPRIAVISCGRRNLFGHPHPTVVKALEKLGVQIWRTDRDGAVDLEVRGPAISVRREIDTPR